MTAQRKTGQGKRPQVIVERDALLKFRWKLMANSRAVAVSAQGFRTRSDLNYSLDAVKAAFGDSRLEVIDTTVGDYVSQKGMKSLRSSFK